MLLSTEHSPSINYTQLQYLLLEITGFVQDCHKQLQRVFKDYSRSEVNIFKAKSTMAIGTFKTHVRMHREPKTPKTKYFIAKYHEFISTTFFEIFLDIFSK